MVDVVEQRYGAIALLARFAVGAILLAMDARLSERLVQRGEQLDVEVRPGGPDHEAGCASLQGLERDLHFGRRGHVDDRRRIGEAIDLAQEFHRRRSPWIEREDHGVDAAAIDALERRSWVRSLLDVVAVVTEDALHKLHDVAIVADAEDDVAFPGVVVAIHSASWQHASLPARACIVATRRIFILAPKSRQPD